MLRYLILAYFYVLYYLVFNPSLYVCMYVYLNDKLLIKYCTQPKNGNHYAQNNENHKI